MTRPLLILVAAAAAILLLEQRGLAPEDAEDDPTYEEPDLLDQADAALQDLTDMGSETTSWEQQNIDAFLWAIRVSEGTSGLNGYSTLFGGRLFSSFADHPRILVEAVSNGKVIKSSAAGAYQILRRTWDDVRGAVGAPDFSPAWQDKCAVELIRRRGALADVRAGRFAIAVDKCKKEWASLPGAGYGQPENSLARLQNAYVSAGGMLA